MTTLALEVQDAGLVAASATGPFQEGDAPGFALLDGKSFVTGGAAARSARLRPRFVHHRFWHELDAEPLGRPFPRGVSTADLAHSHLKDFWSGVEPAAQAVILAVPGSFSEHQLGLVLGIARACEIPVEGLVDAAVAAAAGYDAGAEVREVLHLDIHLHRLILTRLRRSGREIRRRGVETIEEAGLVALSGAVAKRIARLFVQATRYDPLHSAATEQALYDRLPAWLKEIRSQGETELVLEGGGREYVLEVSAADLAPALEPTFEKALHLLRTSRSSQRVALVLVTHRLADLPGFEARLNEISGISSVVVPAGASAMGALAAGASIVAPGDDELPFVTQLPLADDAQPIDSPPVDSPPIDSPQVATPPSAQPTSKRLPTHLVRDGLAYPLRGEPFLAAAPWAPESPNGNGKAPSCRIELKDGVATAEATSARGVFLNGVEITGRVTLTAGDRIRIGHEEARPLRLQLIAVVD